ncbi:MAG: bifunctional 5,10-methylenetetrahydrofolate dehydrogenase/5,10-methenyltetrahydrofolate cyclohydrolase [Candidatus Poribacteria bacterium]
MSATLLMGKPIADKISEQIKTDLAELKEKFGVVPSLASVLVGDDPASKSYSGRQKKSADAVGVKYELHELPGDMSEKKLLDFVSQLNRDANVNGIIIQMPLPKGLDEHKIQSAIAMEKDIEGITPANLGLIVYDRPRLCPCTALSAVKLIESVGADIFGKNLTVVGRSSIVGKPVALLMLQRKYSSTVTICHTGTAKVGTLPDHVGKADILVVAAGSPELVKGDWVKEGSIVIDVGFNVVDGKTVGDVEFEVAKEKAGFITPVPGGVGPLTVAILLQNTVEATKWQLESK